MTLDLETLTLTVGSHAPDGEFCVMEARNAWLGRPWSDWAPAGESPVIAALLRSVNDRADDADRQRLKVYVDRQLGDDVLDHELERACLCAEAVLPIFEARFPEDARPRRAIEIARQGRASKAAAWAAASRAAAAASRAAAAARAEAAEAASRASRAAAAAAAAPDWVGDMIALCDRLIAVGAERG